MNQHANGVHEAATGRDQCVAGTDLLAVKRGRHNATELGDDIVRVSRVMSQALVKSANHQRAFA